MYLTRARGYLTANHFPLPLSLPRVACPASSLPTVYNHPQTSKTHQQIMNVNQEEITLREWNSGLVIICVR